MNCKPPLKSWMRWMGLALALALLVALGGAPKASAADNFRWKLQTIDLQAFPGPSVLLPNLVKRVRDMSGGRLQISVFTAGQLVPTMEIATALEKGTIDISYTSPVYYSGQIPEGNLVPQTLPPMIMPSTYDAKEIYWHRGIDDIFRQAFAEHGIVYLQSVFLGDTIAHWSKKPLRGIEDVKGHKIRSYGYHAKTWSKVGASAVFIPQLLRSGQVLRGGPLLLPAEPGRGEQHVLHGLQEVLGCAAQGSAGSREFRGPDLFR
jgi:TRAP-type mannitol/chloroaromatic compound transport system substrate-binding protein